MQYFEQNDILKQLASRMGDLGPTDLDDWHPLDNAAHDYMVLEWMRTAVRLESPATHKDFISYISGPMHAYVTGDYVKAALFAIGIIDANKK